MSENHQKEDTAKAVLDFLNHTASYPHNPGSVIHLQTHISHVFIVPPYVYKIKKPVDFGFLDYSTLRKRKHFCEQEVNLNRRLCSDIYLGVEPIYRSGSGLRLSSKQNGQVVEYAVKMKKLDDRYFLHSYLAQNALTKDHLDRVAQKLTDFYNGQKPDEKILQYGKIDLIRYNTDENFEQTQLFIGETIDEETLEAIRYFTDRYLEKNEALFQLRVQEQRIVDGHGDLHLEHIHVGPDSICIYDCIEFNERFRYGDLAADLAFLAMDLDFNDRWKEARYLVERMSKGLNDPDLPKIINFYKCYRAYVKGKVKSLQSGEEDVPEQERKAARQKANNYFNLSLRYALLGSQPKVLIFMGRVATGKSTLAQYIANKLRIRLFSSDRVRKKGAGLPLDKRPPEAERMNLYSEEMTQKIYATLRHETKTCIQNDQSVALDATFSSRDSREKLVEAMEAIDAAYLFIEAHSPDKTIIARLRSRDREIETISDARMEDFEMLDNRYEKPNEIDSSNILSIDTDHSFNETCKKLYKKLANRNVKKDA